MKRARYYEHTYGSPQASPVYDTQLNTNNHRIHQKQFAVFAPFFPPNFANLSSPDRLAFAYCCELLLFFAARCVPLMPRVDTRYFKSELCRRGMQINAFIMLDILLSAEIYIYLVNKRICLQTLPRNAFWRCYVAFTGPYLY